MLIGYVKDGKPVFPKVTKEGVCIPLFFLLEELLKRFNIKEEIKGGDDATAY